jgi:phage-related baseplate assembly protein
LLENGQLPDEDMIQKVNVALSSDKVRPLTDYVTVSGPGQKYFAVDLIYYIPADGSTIDIVPAVGNAIKEYVKWQTGKMGRDINPSRLISILMETGVKRVEVIQPVFEKVSELDVAVLGGEVKYVYGGIESG